MLGTERRAPLWPWAAERALLAGAILAVRYRRGAVSTDAYARSGVDQHAADRAVVGAGRRPQDDRHGARESRSVLASGHYAAVLEVAPNLGIAVGTDGVGSKLIVAEQTGRYDTVGIDCVAMNVNDVVCVGAEPIALLDYLAVERADPDVHGRDRPRPEGAAPSRPASRSPAARWRSCPSSSRATRRPTAST